MGNLDLDLSAPNNSEIDERYQPTSETPAAVRPQSSIDAADGAAVQSFEDAYRNAIKLASSMPRLPETSRSLALLTGRVLAQIVAAEDAIPNGNTARVDGYVVQSRDLVGPGPWSFRICGEVSAGEQQQTDVVHRRSVLRVSAGARLQAPFDHVVPLSMVERNGSTISVPKSAVDSTNVQQRGELFAIGEIALSSGKLLSPRDIALIAAIGRHEALVLRKLRVAILSLGEGLCGDGGGAHGAQTSDMNRPMLHAQLDRKWIEVRDFGIIPEGPDTLRLTLDMAAAWADVILTTGGTSGGDDSRIGRALSVLDATTHISGIAMDPGTETRIGQMGSCLFVAMPGNPVGAQIVMKTLAEAMLAHRVGLSGIGPAFRRGVAGHNIDSTAGCTQFRLAIASQDNPAALPTLSFPDSTKGSDIRAFASASGIARIAPSSMGVEAGQELIWFPFSECAG